MRLTHISGACVLLVCVSTASAVDVERPDVAAFIDEMVESYSYERGQLECILADAEIKQSIIDLISKPAERTLTWGEYRKIFLTEERIEAGAEFWRQYSDILDNISESTGVPVEILVGVIGVETYFGRITGGHRVVDALATLAFDYPPRAAFFRRELEQFLLLVREEKMTASDAVGSYAGAMGRPQFMPSSYRAFAVDGTGDGKRDIWNDWTDVAASIANYFIEHDWRTGEDIVVPASLGQRWRGSAPDNSLEPRETVASLSTQGVMFATDMPPTSAGQLLTLETANGAEHWVGFHNFFVITRYNRSVMYALAVHQLGRKIALEVRDG